MLIAVCFSLWRAVFLSDVEENQDSVQHAVEFLENLIAHNSVTYVNDRRTKNWSASYYTATARYHLNQLKHDFPTTFGKVSLAYPSPNTSRTRWHSIYVATEKYLDIFEQKLLDTPEP